MVEATHKNWLPQKFCHLDSLLDGKMAAEFRKKLCVHGYHVYSDIWEAAVGETVGCIIELGNTHDRYAAAGGIHGGKIFMGLIFMVEETHKNFNTTKISAYTVFISICDSTVPCQIIKEHSISFNAHQ